ncbi:uncharacterized protein LOC133204975 [Saccostrea echinata]|uniref:uncharacterized protein LOC133204975 n=1 Tax=Saccostrea echinata TaxID=191078 RepID=UPI002A804FB8|nr:uncharacterized protein LOC133204975 [Saccostrea echinata]
MAVIKEQDSCKQTVIVVKGISTGKIDNNDMELSACAGQSLRRKSSSLWQRAKNRIKITPKDATPVDWKIIGLVFISMFTGTLSLTFLFPFLPEMILFFGYQETEKGYYAGMVASVVFAGRATGSFFWGWLSDRIGRKPVILMTIFGNGFFCLLFGFTTNLPMALIIRFFAGLANGTASIAKAILYEISDDSNQATGLSIVAMSWGAGIILGPAVGGILSNPAFRYPSMFQKDGMFDQFPYLLPSLIVACACFVVIVVDFLVLPETKSTKQRELDVEVEEQNKELQKLVHKTQQKQTHENDRKISLSMEDLHCYTDRTIYEIRLYQSCQDLHRSHDFIMNKTVKTLTEENDTVEALRIDKKTSKCIFNKVKRTSLFEILSMPDCRKAVFLYTAFSFSSIGYEEIFTIWASTKKNYDGLGFETDEIGMVLGLASFPMLALNMFIYPFLDRIFGTKKGKMASNPKTPDRTEIRLHSSVSDKGKALKIGDL